MAKGKLGALEFLQNVQQRSQIAPRIPTPFRFSWALHFQQLPRVSSGPGRSGKTSATGFILSNVELRRVLGLRVWVLGF